MFTLILGQLIKFRGVDAPSVPKDFTNWGGEGFNLNKLFIDILKMQFALFHRGWLWIENSFFE